MKRRQFIRKDAIKRRLYWIEEIVTLSGTFTNDSSRVEQEIRDEIKESGFQALLDHLRLCSAIPESYPHDSSEEKLYSKYTDALISECFKFIGLNSRVLTERADAADVEASNNIFSFVADAKVFRLSRTAKNQKDFKVQAMDGWRNNNDYAMVVCPEYQLPTRKSQIYQQSIERNVCIFTYTHLAVLVKFAEQVSKELAMQLLHQIFQSITRLTPSQENQPYWSMINSTMLNFHTDIEQLLKDEDIATKEGIDISKEIALNHLNSEKARIKNMTKEQAINELIKLNKTDSKIKQIENF